VCLPIQLSGASYGYGGALFKGYAIAQNNSIASNRATLDRGGNQSSPTARGGQNYGNTTNQLFSLRGGLSQAMPANQYNDQQFAQWPTNSGNPQDQMGGYTGRGDFSSNWSDQNVSGGAGFGPQQNMYQGGVQQNHPPQTYPSGYQPQHNDNTQSGYSHYADLYNALDNQSQNSRERRKSLPSIIKERTPVVASLSAVTTGT